MRETLTWNLEHESKLVLWPKVHGARGALESTHCRSSSGRKGSYGVIPIYSGLSGRKSAGQELRC